MSYVDREGVAQESSNPSTVGETQSEVGPETGKVQPTNESEADYIRPPPPLKQTTLPPHPPPSYEATLMNEVLEDIEQIKNNPTTVIDIMTISCNNTGLHMRVLPFPWGIVRQAMRH